MVGLEGVYCSQAHTQGGFGGFDRTPLSAAVIHMNLYGTYVSHTPLIKIRTPAPFTEAGYGPGSSTNTVIPLELHSPNGGHYESAQF